jgi:hypothetical protein
LRAAKASEMHAETAVDAVRRGRSPGSQAIVGIAVKYLKRQLFFPARRRADARNLGACSRFPAARAPFCIASRVPEEGGARR